MWKVNPIIIKVIGNTLDHGSSKDSESLKFFHFKIPHVLFCFLKNQGFKRHEVFQ